MSRDEDPMGVYRGMAWTVTFLLAVVVLIAVIVMAVTR